MVEKGWELLYCEVELNFSLHIGKKQQKSACILFGDVVLYPSATQYRICGSLVKRLRRRPLTAETAVRFRYELLPVEARNVL